MLLEPDGRDIGDPPPVRARAHGGGQKPCRPQFMRIAVLPWPCSQAKDTNQALASGVIVGLFAPVAVGHQVSRKRAIGHRSLDAALHRLMMHAKVFVPRQRTMASPDSHEQHRCPRHPACRFGPATATEPSVLQSPLRPSPTRPLARHPAMMPLLHVRSTTNERESANKLPVP